MVVEEGQVMTVAVFEEDVLRLICGYDSIVDEVWNKNRNDVYKQHIKYMHINSNDEFDGVHGVYDIGQRNLMEFMEYMT